LATEKEVRNFNNFLKRLKLAKASSSEVDLKAKISWHRPFTHIFSYRKLMAFKVNTSLAQQ
jgi:hypothetical protein